MTYHGHNDAFQEAAAIVNSLTDQELELLISMSGETDKYMWPYTKEVSERWGDKGILSWDLCRMGAMVQWTYTAGYLTYREALELVEPAARLAQETFTDWDEFYLNYLDGYSWWARDDVYTLRAKIEEEFMNERGNLDGYKTWMAHPVSSYYMNMSNRTGLLDDSLFKTGVIGLPRPQDGQQTGI